MPSITFVPYIANFSPIPCCVVIRTSSTSSSSCIVCGEVLALLGVYTVDNSGVRLKTTPSVRALNSNLNSNGHAIVRRRSTLTVV